MDASYPVLSAVIFTPIIGAFLLMLLSRRAEGLIKFSALTITILTLILSLPLYTDFDITTHKMQFVEKHPWIKDWNVQYFLGVDGISVLFILLSALVGILCVLISWNSIKEKVKEFYVSILLIEGAMIGVFASMDFFLFYIFWEAMLIPMYLIIGIWGGPRRVYAAIKFILYTLVGSVLMLIGIIVLYLKAGTFEIAAMYKLHLPFKTQLLLFWALFISFAVKVPMWPVHTWLPDAHTEAPTAGSVILAAVLIKMGAYGFLRFILPMFPEASLAMRPLVIVLSIIAILYGALVCLAQTDLKRLIAYSSVSHMGFVTLGIFALTQQSVEGGILQMINHGIVTGALFLAVGIVYDRTHSRQIIDYGGLASVMPVYAGLFMIFTLASIGLPGTNGFIGEFLILLGTFKANKIAAAFAALGIIIGAAYMLWLYKRVFFDEINERIVGLEPMHFREALTLLIMALFVFWIGIYPNAFLKIMHSSVANLLRNYTNITPEPMVAAKALLGGLL